MKSKTTQEPPSNQSIKITYVVDFLRTINAGTERQLAHLLKRLPKLGYCISLISLQDSEFINTYAPKLFPDISIYSLGGQEDISKSPKTLLHLYSTLIKQKPNIVQTFFHTSNSLGIIIAKLAGVKILISSRRDMGFNLTAKDRFLHRACNYFVTCVITNAEAVKINTIEQESIPGNKIHVIHNGIFLGEYKHSAKLVRSPQLIGIVANLNRPVKRVDLFIKAASQVNSLIPNVKFLIAGDGNLRKDLEDLSNKLGLNNVVNFLGSVRSIKDTLQTLSIGVIASDSEGLSNAIMEYMERGIPVIATNTGGNSELVIDGITGLLVPPGDVDSMAKAMIKLLNEHSLSTEMGRRGRAYMENNFHIDKLIQKTSNLYKHLQTNSK